MTQIYKNIIKGCAPNVHTLKIFENWRFSHCWHPVLTRPQQSAVSSLHFEGGLRGREGHERGPGGGICWDVSCCVAAAVSMSFVVCVCLFSPSQRRKNACDLCAARSRRTGGFETRFLVRRRKSVKSREKCGLSKKDRLTMQRGGISFLAEFGLILQASRALHDTGLRCQIAG